ncbi:MAG TPA: hypothetical protein VFZ08_12280 [Terriglobia bacterium]|nr:hypothetical protein [Terriglobia bacterium]
MGTLGICSPTRLSDLSSSPLISSATLDEKTTLSARETTYSLEEPRISVQYSSSQAFWPNWARDVVDGLLDLMDLRPNWDSYGAGPIEGRAVERAVPLLFQLMTDDSPSPSTIPTSMGGIQLEWHQQGIDLEITIPPIGLVTAFVHDDATGEEWELGLSDTLSRVKQIIMELRR